MRLNGSEDRVFEPDYRTGQDLRHTFGPEAALGTIEQARFHAAPVVRMQARGLVDWDPFTVPQVQILVR